MRRSDRDEAFTEYVVARRAHLRRTAYLICGDWHAAEDLVQTALTRLYTAWPRVIRRDAVEAYARRIIVRAHVDEGRRPWRRETPGVDGFDQAADESVEYGERDRTRSGAGQTAAAATPGSGAAALVRPECA